MPSPLPPQLPSSQTASVPSRSTSSINQHRKSSADKSAAIKRNSSTSSLHRSTSSKSTLSTKNSKHHHHQHVAHTSASKHHRATSFGHRVPSYGKGLNKLTALTTVTSANPPTEPHKGFLTIEDLVARAGGMSMQRSYSEGATLGKKERRQSSNSVHSSRPRVQRPQSHSHATNKPPKAHVTFSTQHSSDEDDDDDQTLVHRRSTDIVASPTSQHNDLRPPNLQQQIHSPAPYNVTSHRTPLLQQKSALKEGLSSTPKFLQKNLSQVALVPPKVSMTNAVSKDQAKASSTGDQTSLPDINATSAGSSGIVGPSSNPVSHFLTSTPPSRAPRTPDLDMTSLHQAPSSTSLAIQADALPPLTTPSHGKLTRTQQKLLLQRASTQPLTITTSYSSPSLPQTTQMEHATDYFSPLPSTTAGMTPGAGFVTMTYDVKVAREFERISRELANARRFGDPVTDALKRLQMRMNPTQPSLNKKSSTFGLSVSWKRSPEKEGRARVDVEDRVFGGEGRSRVREIMRRLWFDEVELGDVGREEVGKAGSVESDDEDGEEVRLGRGFRGRRGSPRSQ